MKFLSSQWRGIKECRDPVIGLLFLFVTLLQFYRIRLVVPQILATEIFHNESYSAWIFCVYAAGGVLGMIFLLFCILYQNIVLAQRMPGEGFLFQFKIVSYFPFLYVGNFVYAGTKSWLAPSMHLLCASVGVVLLAFSWIPAAMQWQLVSWTTLSPEKEALIWILLGIIPPRNNSKTKLSYFISFF